MFNRDDVDIPEVSWLGLRAVYTEAERAILAPLTLKEQTFLHVLKSLTDGEIRDTPSSHLANAGVTRSGDAAPEKVPVTVYIDAEDIPFGEDSAPRSPRKRPIYALVWTGNQGKIVKTKTRATRSMRSWKKWKERQGWKVSSHPQGYFAGLNGERQAITLREYDPVTHERLK